MYRLHNHSSSKYKNASKRCKRVQKKAIKEYNEKLKSQLDKMDRSEKAFWKLTKEIAGQSRPANKATPSVDDLADHFAKKMSNAKDDVKENWRPRDGKRSTFLHSR